MSGSDTLDLLAKSLGTVSTVGQGFVNQQTANYNAGLADTQARYAATNAGLNEARARNSGAQQIADQVAGAGSSGLTLEGSPTDAIRQNATNIEMDALTERYKGQVQTAGFASRARMLRAQGAQQFDQGIASAGVDLLKSEWERRRRTYTGLETS